MFFSYFFSSINKAFSKILLFWIGVTCLIGTLIICLVEMVEYGRRLVRTPTVSLSDIFPLILFKIPGHLQLILPFVMFIAAFITLTRLNRDSELTAVRALGIPFKDILGGLTGVTLICFSLLLIAINPIASFSNQKHHEKECLLFGQSVLPLRLLQNGIWLREKINPGKGASQERIVHIRSIDSLSKQFQGVTFYLFSQKEGLKDRLIAPQATIEKNQWVLFHATLFPMGHPPQSFSRVTRNTSLSFDQIVDSQLPPDFLSFWRLPAYIQLLDQSGLSSIKYTVAWHGIWGSLGLFIAMIYLAGAFSLRPIRQGQSGKRMGQAGASILVFYFINNFFIALGFAEKFPVWLAVWGPSFLTLLFSHILILHLEEG